MHIKLYTVIYIAIVRTQVLVLVLVHIHPNINFSVCMYVHTHTSPYALEVMCCLIDHSIIVYHNQYNTTCHGIAR